MSSRISISLSAVACFAALALHGPAATQAQSYEVWEPVPAQNGTPLAQGQISAAPQQPAPDCSQLVARFNQITRARMSTASAFNARYGNMTLSSRKLTGFCSAYEDKLATMYRQVGEMNYLAEMAAATCPARVPMAIRRQADETWADYSSGSARFGAECNFDTAR